MEKLNIEVKKLEERETKLEIIDSGRFCAAMGIGSMVGGILGMIVGDLLDLMECCYA